MVNIKQLNKDEGVADKDACLIEHVISNESIKAMQEFLDRQK